METTTKNVELITNINLVVRRKHLKKNVELRKPARRAEHRRKELILHIVPEAVVREPEWHFGPPGSTP